MIFLLIILSLLILMNSKYKITPPDVHLPWKLTGENPPGFDENVLPSPQKGFTFGVVGGRNTGKSVLVFNLLKHYQGAFDGIFVMMPTWKQDPTISPMATGIDEEAYFEKIDVGFIEELIEKQMEEKRKFDKGNLRQKYLSRYLIVFDDCIGDPNFGIQNGGILNKLATKGRHYRISFIAVSQAYKAFPKRFRINICNWIFTKSYNESERRAITEEQSNTMSEKKFNELFEYAIEGEYNFFYVFMDCPDKKACFRKNLETVLKVE